MLDTFSFRPLLLPPQVMAFMDFIYALFMLFICLMFRFAAAIELLMMADTLRRLPPLFDCCLFIFFYHA